MPEVGDAPLAGLQVLVTRPAHQAAGLSHLLEQAGAGVVRLPVFAIDAGACHSRLQPGHGCSIHLIARQQMHAASAPQDVFRPGGAQH